ncbi:MAG: dTDP-4-dehydrorhamnose 3,5-epimerase [Candidatus Paceibacterota bacterium]|jgi:dTDP-4-dehydrorhamnose 3,5-epimerase
MQKIETKLSGLVVIEPDVHGDDRGFFMETYHKGKFHDLGIDTTFVQDSHSHSVKGVIRGLKFQYDEPTDKLVRVAYGKIFAVGVDLRPGSETFGKWDSVELSGENKRMLYLPFGFAFGFCVTGETAGVLYKLSALHNDAGSGTIRFDDPDIGVDWPEKSPIVSKADAAAETFKEWQERGGATTMAVK